MVRVTRKTYGTPSRCPFGSCRVSSPTQCIDSLGRTWWLHRILYFNEWLTYNYAEARDSDQASPVSDDRLDKLGSPGRFLGVNVSFSSFHRTRGHGPKLILGSFGHETLAALALFSRSLKSGVFSSASLNGVHLSFNLLDIISYCHVRADTRQPTRIGRGFRLLNHQAPDTYPYHTTPSLPPSSIHPPGRPLRHSASALFLLPLSYHVLSTFWTVILSLVS